MLILYKLKHDVNKFCIIWLKILSQPKNILVWLQCMASQSKLNIMLNLESYL